MEAHQARGCILKIPTFAESKHQLAPKAVPLTLLPAFVRVNIFALFEEQHAPAMALALGARAPTE